MVRSICLVLEVTRRANSEKYCRASSPPCMRQWSVFATALRAVSVAAREIATSAMPISSSRTESQASESGRDRAARWNQELSSTSTTMRCRRGRNGEQAGVLDCLGHARRSVGGEVVGKMINTMASINDSFVARLPTPSSVSSTALPSRPTCLGL